MTTPPANATLPSTTLRSTQQGRATPPTVAILGLRTAICPSPDLAVQKSWYTALLGYGPYFDEPFYVGFEVGGYELGLMPDGDPADGPSVLWGVDDIDAAMAALVAGGATTVDEITDVGGGIRTAAVLDGAGNRFGLIENPHFRLPTT